MKEIKIIIIWNLPLFHFSFQIKFFLPVSTEIRVTGRNLLLNCFSVFALCFSQECLSMPQTQSSLWCFLHWPREPLPAGGTNMGTLICSQGNTIAHLKFGSSDNWSSWNYLLAITKTFLSYIVYNIEKTKRKKKKKFKYRSIKNCFIWIYFKFV